MSQTKSTGSPRPAQTKNDTVQTVLKIVGLIACVFFFIVGIKMLSSSFKLFGKGFAESILTSTASPYVGLFVGILSTALVQSSSTTTSVVVGMVAGDVLTLTTAIPIIMGANIGTTVTNSLVSMGHMTQSDEFKRAFSAATVHDFFNLLAVCILFPLELLTGFLAKSAEFLTRVFQGAGGMELADPLSKAIKPVVKLIMSGLGNQKWFCLIGAIAITIIMLIVIVKLLRSLMLNKIKMFFDQYLFRNWGLAMGVGFIITVGVQSSSITTSLVIPLAAAGALTLRQIFPYTMGANVGTTMTAILAALATPDKPVALTVAFAHLLFNISGILIVWPFPKIREIPIKCAEWLADESVKRRWVPVVFIITIFFLIPLILVFTTPKREAESSEPNSKRTDSVVTTTGSDSMVILMTEWAQAFSIAEPEIKVQINGGGSRNGFAAILENTARIASASRKINPEEQLEFMKKFGKEPQEHVVCLDGLSIYVNETNPVESLSFLQLKQIYTGKITNWSQLGGPDRPVLAYSRENSSGTYEYFRKKVMEGADYAPRTQYITGTAGVVEAVRNSPGAIGFGGAAYARTIKVLAVKKSKEDKPLLPTPETVTSNRYPLTRELFLYVIPGDDQNNIDTFVEWIMGPEGKRIVSDVGYFPLP